MMDFRKLVRSIGASDAPQNVTEPLGFTELPPNILETLIPGYGLISRYIASAFGIDISVFVSIGIILVAIIKGSQYLYEKFQQVFRRFFVSSVYIDEDDDLFDMVMGWLAENHGGRSRRSMRAKTQRGSRTDEATTAEDGQDALDEYGMFDYNKWSARTPPRYEPHYGRHMLWHKGRLFFFRRAHREATGRLQIHYGGGPDDDILQLDCFGSSAEPIKDLLRTIKIWSLDKLRYTTTIRHPTPKDRARFGGSWSKTFSRPSRPMDTVILDNEQKIGIVKDMNEFLHPASPRWYAARGIPYRRGYLFHGPPGTGKTSLSFALAGIFGLEIYAISLQEPTLNEGDLMQLFNGLPRRCVVLLEDIDAAGLIRDGQSNKDEDGKPKSGKKSKGDKETKDAVKTEESQTKDEGFTIKDLAREIRALGGSNDRRGNGNNSNNNSNHNNGNERNRAPGTGISLSGLLNAIDGVATHEGRVLIMTTNHPEKLDAALVRPGRVDRKVEFRLALKEQIRELFVRMYAATDLVPELKTDLNKALTHGHAKKSERNGTANGLVNSDAKKQLANLSSDEVEALAIEFAEHVPDDTFTPAEIQNHLMLHKFEPSTAVATADTWIRQLTEEKEKQRRAREEADDENGDT